MSLMDFLFGKPERTTSTQITTQQLPDEIKPGAKLVIDEAEKLYKDRVARGPADFGKSTIADLGEDELAAIAGLKSLVGVQDPYIDQYEKDIGAYKDAIGDIDIEFTADIADKFASPYLSAVLDVQKRKAEEDFQRRVMPEFEKQAVSAGGMSGLGSRAGVQAALLGDAFSRQLGDIEAIGREKAFQDAYTKFKEEGDRRRTIAGDLLDASGMARDIGTDRLDSGLAEFGLLKSIGEEDREFRQAKLGEEYARFLEEDEFIPTELARLSGFVTGSPFTKALSTTQENRKPSATPTQQVFGLGLEGLRDRRSRRPTGFGFSNQALLGNFARVAEGGQVGRKMGGGLASALPLVQRSMAGQAGTGQKAIPGSGLGAEALYKGLGGLGLSQEQQNVIKLRGTLEQKRQQETANIAKKTIDNFKERSSKALDNIKKRDKKFLEELGKINKDTLDIINPEAAKQIIDPKEAGITAAQSAVLDEDAGRFGAVGLLALTMSKYAEGKSKAEQDQYKLVRKAALDSAKIKTKQAEVQDLRQKGQNDKADEIQAEVDKLQTNLDILKANIPANVFDAAQKATTGQLDQLAKVAKTQKDQADAASKGKSKPENITTQMKTLSTTAKDSLSFQMQGNVSVGPDGSIRVKQSFYGNDKKLQNKVNSQLAQAYEKALREIGTKPINTISADFSATVRGILELDPKRPNIK
jgi:hypothetical protein